MKLITLNSYEYNNFQYKTTKTVKKLLKNISFYFLFFIDMT